MRCIHCGREIEDDNLFCPFCGGNLLDEVKDQDPDTPVSEETVEIDDKDGEVSDEDVQDPIEDDSASEPDAEAETTEQIGDPDMTGNDPEPVTDQAEAPANDEEPLVSEKEEPQSVSEDDPAKDAGSEEGQSKRICPHCGMEVDPDDAFCPYCGATVDAVESEPGETIEKEEREGLAAANLATSTVTEDFQAIMPPEAEQQELGSVIEPELNDVVDVDDAIESITAPTAPSQKKSHKTLIVVLLALLLSGVVFAVTAFVYPGFLAKTSVPLDLTGMTSIYYEGYNGEAVLTDISFNEDEVLKHLDTVEDNATRESIQEFLDTVEFSADKTENLSNGDEVTVTATYDETAYAKLNDNPNYRVALTGLTGTYEIDNLEERPKKTVEDIRGFYLNMDQMIQSIPMLMIYPIDDKNVLCVLSQIWGAGGDYLFFSGKLDSSEKITFSDGFDVSIQMDYDTYSGPQTITVNDAAVEGVLDASKDHVTISIKGGKSTFNGKYDLDRNYYGPAQPSLARVNVDKGEHLNLRGKDGKVIVKLDPGEQVYDFSDVYGLPSFNVKGKNDADFDVVYSEKRGKWGIACYDYLE